MQYLCMSHLEKDYENQVWLLLKETDYEFIPPLSSRNGTQDKKFEIANQEFTITSYRVHKEYDMLTLKDINNINQIIDLKGENVYIDKKYLNLNDNEYLDEDLLNLDLYMGNNYLGKVEKIEYLTKNKKLLIVSKHYIPFELVKEIDFLNKKIIIEEVSGL